MLAHAHVSRDCAMSGMHRSKIGRLLPMLVDTLSYAAVQQGEDVMHDAIRQQQVEAGVPALIATALTAYEGQNEEVLWAALFSLAVLIREGMQPYELSTIAAVEAGLLPLLKVALKDYEVHWR